MTEVNAFGQFLIKDEMMNLFFNDYFFIKKDGLIPGYIDEIEEMFRQVKNTDVYEKMVREYQTLKQVGEYQARDIIGYDNFIFIMPPLSYEEFYNEIGNPKAEYEKVHNYKNVIFWSFSRKDYQKTN